MIIKKDPIFLYKTQKKCKANNNKTILLVSLISNYMAYKKNALGHIILVVMASYI